MRVPNGSPLAKVKYKRTAADDLQIAIHSRFIDVLWYDTFKDLLECLMLASTEDVLKDPLGFIEGNYNGKEILKKDFAKAAKGLREALLTVTSESVLTASKLPEFTLMQLAIRERVMPGMANALPNVFAPVDLCRYARKRGYRGRLETPKEFMEFVRFIYDRNLVYGLIIEARKNSGFISESGKFPILHPLGGRSEHSPLSLIKQMRESLTPSSLALLAKQAGVDPHEITGEGFEARCMSLVEMCEQQDKLPALLAACREKRSNLVW